MSAKKGRPFGSKTVVRETEAQRIDRETQIRELGAGIRERRIKLDISQSDLAKWAGSSAPQISALENGLANPTLGTLIPILTVLGLRLELKKTVPAVPEKE